MTRQRGGTTSEEKASRPLPPRVTALFSGMYQRGILGVLLVCFAVVTAVGLVQQQGGVFVEWWATVLRRTFGWGSYVVTLAIAAVGVLILLGKLPERGAVPWHVLLGAEIMFLALLSLSHLFAPGPDAWAVAHAGEGGGYLGGLLSRVLGGFLGTGFAVFALSVMLGWGAIVASGVSLEEWADRAEAWTHALRVRASQLLRGDPTAAEPEGAELSEQAEPAQAPVAQADDGQPSAPLEGRVPRQRRIKVSLPPVGILDRPTASTVDEADVQQKKRTIEVTLAQFGVPAEVVEINRGPMVTQFGVEPGHVLRTDPNGEEKERRVRVATISGLSKDLALALAASPIRIEAPIPGRSLVGIEVPNSQVSVVSLRSVMDTDAFRDHKSALALPLGAGVDGSPLVADMAKMPHLLIAGATGSGKSVCINALATALLFRNSPLTLRMVMIDPKRVEMRHYNQLPHLYGRVESEVDRIVGVLHWLVNEMQERYRRFAQIGARHIDDYNTRWQLGSSEYLPRIVTFVDELADLMLFAPEDVERSICRLAQMARATGMHLVLATQRPSVDVVTGLIKANFPARIAFAVSSGTDSRVILDGVGAETLLGSGDLLYMSPESAGFARAQGSYVARAEVERLVRYWQDWALREQWDRGATPWATLIDRENALSGDDLLSEAIEIIREQGNASASLLQRRMHIGYPRAARLIDELERLGLVGPQEAGGRARAVLDLTSFDSEAPLGPDAGV